MTYDFSFQKKSLILLLAGVSAVVLLMFFIGFMIGVRLQPAATVAAAGAKLEAPKIEKPKLELKKAEAEKPSEGGAAGKTETESKAPAPEAAVSPAAEGAFAIQLGAFRDGENAKKMADDYKARGYKPFVFKGLDSQDHPWHTVRLGPYPDMPAAAHAAQELNNKEGIQSFVRPANVL